VSKAYRNESESVPHLSAMNTEADLGLGYRVVQALVFIRRRGGVACAWCGLLYNGAEKGTFWIFVRPPLSCSTESSAKTTTLQLEGQRHGRFLESGRSPGGL
jgi:hypothetical protein